MQLMTKEIRRTLPALYGTEYSSEVVARVKYFTPWSNWTWYGVEFDGEDQFFGLVEGFEREWGFFSLGELEAIRGPGGVRIERDMYFEPLILSSKRGVLGAPRVSIFASDGNE